jgi:hypothetical protein
MFLQFEAICEPALVFEGGKGEMECGDVAKWT